MFCYTYSSVLTFVDSFYQFLYCFMHPLHGARHMRPCIRYTQQRAFCYSFSEKNIFGFPQTVCRIFPFICAQTDAQKRYSRSEMRTREKTQAML